jgi:23S rRNA (uridine2552-2'-O)-methyltransferase
MGLQFSHMFCWIHDVIRCLKKYNMGRKHQTRRGDWVARRARDPYARQAQVAGYRSRAAWKLLELDQKDRLFRKGSVVIDLGAAPGSWSQVALAKTGPMGRVVAVDQNPIEPLANLEIIQGDFTAPAVRAAVCKAVEGAAIDLVLCDMAPNISGVRDVDQVRCTALARMARDFALACLGASGGLVVKLFEGTEAAAFQRETRGLFEMCTARKPIASRSESSEYFLVAHRAKVP